MRVSWKDRLNIFSGRVNNNSSSSFRKRFGEVSNRSKSDTSDKDDVVYADIEYSSMQKTYSDMVNSHKKLQNSVSNASTNTSLLSPKTNSIAPDEISELNAMRNNMLSTFNTLKNNIKNNVASNATDTSLLAPKTNNNASDEISELNTMRNNKLLIYKKLATYKTLKSDLQNKLASSATDTSMLSPKTNNSDEKSELNAIRNNMLSTFNALKNNIKNNVASASTDTSML